MSQRKAGFGWVLLGACLFLACDMVSGPGKGEVFSTDHPPKGTVCTVWAPRYSSTDIQQVQWAEDSRSLFIDYLDTSHPRSPAYLRQTALFTAEGLFFRVFSSRYYISYSFCLDEAADYVYTARARPYYYSGFGLSGYIFRDYGDDPMEDRFFIDDNQPRYDLHFTPDGTGFGYWVNLTGSDQYAFAVFDRAEETETQYFTVDPHVFDSRHFCWWPTGDSIVTAIHLSETEHALARIYLDGAYELLTPVLADVLDLPSVDPLGNRVVFQRTITCMGDDTACSLCEYNLVTGEFTDIIEPETIPDDTGYEYVLFDPAGEWVAFIETNPRGSENLQALKAIYWPLDE